VAYFFYPCYGKGVATNARMNSRRIGFFYCDGRVTEGALRLEKFNYLFIFIRAPARRLWQAGSWLIYFHPYCGKKRSHE